MKSTAFALAALAGALLLGACERSNPPTTTNRPANPPPRSTAPDSSPSTPMATPPSTARPAPDKDVDNTAQNKRDRDNATPTPMDQSNSKDAIRITADIRKALMDDSSLSTKAHNVKIITDDKGVVTLRGTVDSQVEKDSVEAKAKTVAGVNSVVNQLEVKGG
jgi:hypothetical protein